MTIKSIVLIGTGNVAWHLGIAFVKAGIEIKQVAGRDAEKAKELAGRLNCSLSCALEEDLADADMYMLAVKDDAIRVVGETIFRQGRLLVHNAGAVSGTIVNIAGNNFGVLWPMQTLTKKNDIDLHQTLIAVSGSSSEIEKALKELASKITERAIVVSEEQRGIMHLSAVWINNYTNHMFNIASQLLKEHHLNLDLFFPLMEEHMLKLKEIEPDQLQTGPAKRGDMATLAKHKNMLQNHLEWQQLYDTLSKSILNEYLNK